MTALENVVRSQARRQWHTIFDSWPPTVHLTSQFKGIENEYKKQNEREKEEKKAEIKLISKANRDRWDGSQQVDSTRLSTN